MLGCRKYDMLFSWILRCWKTLDVYNTQVTSRAKDFRKQLIVYGHFCCTSPQIKVTLCFALWGSDSRVSSSSLGYSNRWKLGSPFDIFRSTWQGPTSLLEDLCSRISVIFRLPLVTEYCYLHSCLSSRWIAAITKYICYFWFIVPWLFQCWQSFCFQHGIRAKGVRFWGP